MNYATRRLKQGLGLVLAAVSLSAGLTAALLPTAHAAAPQVKTTAPGFYRAMLGDFEVTALSDGTVALPVDQLLIHTTPAHIKQVLADNFESSPLETSVNAFLINTGSKLVLVDTGTSHYFGPSLGRLQESLKAAGYQPEQVDEVYITHMHMDHIGGLMAGEARAFPNAIVRADKHDADFWLSQAQMDKAPAERKDSFKNAMAVLDPYVKAGKFLPFNGDTELVPGIKAHASYGHTPGHTTYVIESKGQRLVLWGDLMHVAALQFPEPGISVKFDSDIPAALAQRKAAFGDAAAHGDMVGAAHLPFPGLGHLRKQGAGYKFVPLNYSVVN
ncbi:MAG: MBL fold metallo-hydrolase [Burkholderiaceae bacterium]|nr:MBL fold metallo-hydrolase [Burkholderiaceae bacterium]